MPRSLSLALLLPLALSKAANAQQFSYTPGLIPGPAQWTEGVLCVDVDHDGDLDLCFADGEGFAGAGPPRQNRLVINKLVETGSLAFVDESVARLGTHISNAKDVTAGDVDGDGWVDLLFINAFNTDPPWLYINQGPASPGVFILESASRGFTTPHNAATAQFGDLDDDGDLDVIFCDSGPSFLGNPGGKPRLYFNNGAGFFSEDPTALNAPIKIGHMDVQLADVDNDWDLDFFCFNRGMNSGINHYLMLNDGAGNFTDVSSLLPTTSANVYEAEVADLDGDLDLDLFFLSFSGFKEAHVQNTLIENGTLGFAPGSTQPGQVDDNEVALLDYDNDLDLDVVIGSLGSQERLYRNDGGLTFTPANSVIQAVGDSTLDLTVGDLDNDGDYDIVTVQGESNPGQWINKVYTNSGSPDDLAPRVTRLDIPAQAPAWPAVLHAQVQDQVRDDAQSYLSARAVAAPQTGITQQVALSGGVFTPSQLQIQTGTSVVFTNQEASMQTVTSSTPPFQFDYQLSPGQMVERIFVTPGVYDYTSTVNGATGQIVVTGVTTTVDALHSGGAIYRVAIPQLAASPVDRFAVELFLRDWPGNEHVVDNRVVIYPSTSIGTNYCSPAVANSSGAPATIAATGSEVAVNNVLILTAQSLPPQEFGYFLASMTQGFVPNPGASQGNLCLGGQIGRFRQQIQLSSPGGSFAIQVDLTNIPVSPPHSVLAGETWNFQAWFRDKPGTSNFTDGVSVTFR